MKITRSSIETTLGPSDWFTGNVYVDTIAAPEPPARAASALVHFTRAPAPTGTRTRSGRRSSSPKVSAAASARAARSRRSAPAIACTSNPARTTGTAPRPTRFMAHVAIQEADESGSPVTWGEPVTDEQYNPA